MQRFAAEKELVPEAAKQGDQRTSLKSASPKTRGLGYLGTEKQGGLRHGER